MNRFGTNSLFPIRLYTFTDFTVPSNMSRVNVSCLQSSSEKSTSVRRDIPVGDFHNSSVAQLVERKAFNLVVVGSSPSRGKVDFPAHF